MDCSSCEQYANWNVSARWNMAFYALRSMHSPDTSFGSLESSEEASIICASRFVTPFVCEIKTIDLMKAFTCSKVEYDRRLDEIGM